MASYTLKSKSNKNRIVTAEVVRRRRMAAIAVLTYISDHDEKSRERVQWKKPWLHHHDQYGIFPNLVREMELADMSSFTNFFRMSPALFNELAEKVAPLIKRSDTNFHKAVPPNERLGVTLRYLATGETFKSLSYSFRLGATSIGHIVPETCRAIYEVLKDEYLQMPETEEDWLRISKGFQEKWNFPNTLGAIDGKHIALLAPSLSGSGFYNYKHFFSIVLMALVDHSYKFIYVDVGCNGRVSDGGVFSACTLKSALDKKLANIPKESMLPGDSSLPMSYHFLGDEAFPLREDLMKPFPFRNLSADQKVFNYRLSRARRVVENAFGIMASRFRVFLGRILLAPEKVEQVVLAACTLHNFLLSRNDNAYVGPGVLDDEDEDHHVTPGSWRSSESLLRTIQIAHSNNAGFEPKQKREQIMEYLVSPTGSVPWQNDMI